MYFSLIFSVNRDAKDACEGLNNSKIGPYRCFEILRLGIVIGRNCV